MRQPILVFALVALALPLASRASDGVLEINQDCAIATGCFPGDAPGWPVTIRGFNLADPFAPFAPARSFRLTSDLGFLGPNDSAIIASANAATIDLGGFRILGPVQCGGAPLTCSPLGSGVGVLGGSDVVVKNGTISGMGNDGVRIDYSSRAESLHAYHNGGDGIDLGNESLARGNVSTSNGFDGIRCASHCGVHENTAVGNGANGILVASGSVTRNTASQNGSFGLVVGANTVFAHNALAGNSSGDRSGGRGLSANVCADGSCRSGPRRFYLAKNLRSAHVVGDNQCHPGFHFAAWSELHDPSTLEYDTVRGHTHAGSGSGAPSGVYGWVRSGLDPILAASYDCNGWTSFSGADDGWAVRLMANTGLAMGGDPWTHISNPCSNDLRVWCVENWAD